MNLFRKNAGIPQGRKATVYITGLIAAAVLAFGIYNMVSVNYFSKIAVIPSLVTVSQTPGPGGAGGKMPAPGGKINGFPGQGFGKGPTPAGNRYGRMYHAGRSVKGGGPKTGIFSILATYIGVIAGFATVTYYFEKLLFRLSRRNAA